MFENFISNNNNNKSFKHYSENDKLTIEGYFKIKVWYTKPDKNIYSVAWAFEFTDPSFPKLLLKAEKQGCSQIVLVRDPELLTDKLVIAFDRNILIHSIQPCLVVNGALCRQEAVEVF